MVGGPFSFPFEFKQHQLPLARIKRIMKSDEDVKMISADAPILFAKACELFILDLTLRSWFHAEEKKRRTLQRVDIANAVSCGEVLDFLMDIVPMDQVTKDDYKLGGNFVSPDSFTSPGMHFPVVPPNAFHQTPPEVADATFLPDHMNGQSESFHQFMNYPSPSNHPMYDPPQ